MTESNVTAGRLAGLLMMAGPEKFAGITRTFDVQVPELKQIITLALEALALRTPSDGEVVAWAHPDGMFNRYGMGTIQDRRDVSSGFTKALYGSPGEATMAREWCDFCAAIGVDVDTHDAVADQVLAMGGALAPTKAGDEP